MWKIKLPNTETYKQAGWILWPIFGATNQMLAGLILMVLTLYFWKKTKNVLPLFIPMIFIIFIAITSLFLKLVEFYKIGNLLLFSLSFFLIILILTVIFEGIKFYINTKYK
jgi:carbon starvation protein